MFLLVCDEKEESTELIPCTSFSAKTVLENAKKALEIKHTKGTKEAIVWSLVSKNTVFGAVCRGMGRWAITLTLIGVKNSNISLGGVT